MNLSIVIVNYNTPELVYDCLKSIRQQIAGPCELIVVDNASSQPVVPSLLGEGVTYLPLPKNLGFGGGNNAGAKLATAKYLWFLNSDTWLPDGSYVDLLAFMDSHPDFAVCSPLLYLDPGCRQLQPDFYARFQSFRTLLTRQVRPLLQLHEPFQKVDLVVGAALMIRRERFEAIGGFDEQIFMYMEDDDLCYRAGAVAVVTTARIVHLQGSSISVNARRKRLYYVSQTYFWRKHYGWVKTVLMRLLRAPYALLRQ